MKEYRKENFRKETLEECNLDNICAREKYWIEKLNAINPEIGYNIRISSGDGHLGRRLSTKAKQKISNANTGRKKSKEDLITLSINNGRYWKDKHRPLSTRIKLSKANLGKKHSEETKKRIRLANIGKHFHACSQEQKELLSKINQGKRTSKETRLKITEGLKRAWKTIRRKNEI
jgi:hypothetical protein